MFNIIFNARSKMCLFCLAWIYLAVEFDLEKFNLSSHEL